MHQEQEEPCALAHLKALIPIYDRWDVTATGAPGDYWQPGETDRFADQDDVEEYVCENCGKYFTPADRYTRETLAQAWEAAVAHLGTTEVVA